MQGGGFVSAPALALLNFERNKLDKLPAELASLKKLKTLLLADNPLDSKIKKMLEKGGPKVSRTDDDDDDDADDDSRARVESSRR